MRVCTTCDSLHLVPVKCNPSGRAIGMCNTKSFFTSCYPAFAFVVVAFCFAFFNFFFILISLLLNIIISFP